MKNQQVTRAIARKVLQTVDQGLCRGLGEATPGQMCVEAAVCYAYGLPHSDQPPCVGAAVREFKIRLNDSNWSSNAARAAGMRALAIAQLGSAGIDQEAFVEMLAEGTIRVVVPMALRAAAARLSPPQRDKLLAAADVCEREGTEASARAAAYAANAAAYAANAAANAAAAAAANAEARDEVLTAAADVALQCLYALGSPGCEYLDLLA